MERRGRGTSSGSPRVEYSQEPRGQTLWFWTIDILTLIGVTTVARVLFRLGLFNADLVAGNVDPGSVI